MSSQRHRRDNYACDPEPERHHRRSSRSSRSRSRSKRYRHRDSRSRTRSVERRRHRRRSSRSRSRSRDYSSRRDGRYSRRNKIHSRSQSHSSSRSSFRRSRTRTPTLIEKNKRRDKRQSEYERDVPEPRTEQKPDHIDLANLPLPKREAIGAYYNLDTDEPFDKERIHREMEEKLRQTLAREGKVYPPPKPEASHPVFANDGSFLEIFKKMQAQAPSLTQISTVKDVPAVPPIVAAVASTSTAVYVAATAAGKSAPPPPIFGRRRGGKILKTGVVAKQKSQTENGADPKDFWSLYLAEVNKYKKTACETDSGTRPLVK